MAYQHTVLSIFDPEDTVGFVYTKHDTRVSNKFPKFELFALDVPYDMVNHVADLMNFLSRREVLPNQTARAAVSPTEDLIWDIVPEFLGHCPTQCVYVFFT